MNQYEPKNGPAIFTVAKVNRGVIRIGRWAGGHAQGQQGGGARGKVGAFTEGSRRRALGYLGSCTARYACMGTLTVREWDKNGGWFKDALDRYLVWQLRQQQRAAERPREESIFWWLEFQRRGAPHAHMVYTSPVPWELASRRWAEGVGQPEIAETCTKFETLREAGAMPAYVSKYMAKADQKEVPQGYVTPGRWWGVRGCRTISEAILVLRRGKNDKEWRNNVWKLLEAWQVQGKVKITKWKTGNGISVYPTRGLDLERSGIVGKMMLELAKGALTEDKASFSMYEPTYTDEEVTSGEKAWGRRQPAKEYREKKTTSEAQR